MHLWRELICLSGQAGRMNVHITPPANVAEMNHFVTPKPRAVSSEICYAVAVE
jgi:hypothetical protein